MYPIITVPDDASELPEQLGTKYKFWFRDSNQVLTLFKQGRPGTGENWAEKVCAELAASLGVPHAPYELARWRRLNGVVSPTFVPDGARLVLGNEIMGRVVKGYAQTATYNAREHSLISVLTIMSRPRLGMPLNYAAPPAVANAQDVFLGYLMLDALVANQDRHHENWAVISQPGLGVTLAPTFDHASSLGRNEQDEVRLRRLRTRDAGANVDAYCTRARSAFYPRVPGAKPLYTHDAFREAAKASVKATKYWLERLGALSLTDCEAIVQNVPESEITEPAAAFALKMIEVNRQRLLALKF